MPMVDEKKRAKRVAKLDKIQEKIDKQMEKIAKAQWKQAALSYDKTKALGWRQEEMNINRKLAKLRSEMVKKFENPHEMFQRDHLVWYAAKYGVVGHIQAHVRTPGALEHREEPTLNTPLIVAAINGHLDCVQYLVQAQADVNAVNALGKSALHEACEKRHAEVVAYLMSLPQVDPFIRARNGLLPHQIIRAVALVYGDKWGRYAKCASAVEQRICVLQGWLFESQPDALVNRYIFDHVGIKAHSWVQSYVRVLRTGGTELEIVVYIANGPDSCPAVPVRVIMYTMGDPVESPIRKRNLNNKPHTFSVEGTQEFPSRNPVKENFEFAALNEEALGTWMNFFSNMLIELSAMSAATNRLRGASAGGRGSISVEPLEQLFPSLHLPPAEEPHEELFPVNPEPQELAYEKLFPASAKTMSPEVLSPNAPPLLEPVVIAAVPSAPPFRASILESSPAAPAPVQKGECVVCMDNPREGVCVPCGHHAVCMDCAGLILSDSKACPVCRADIREIVRMYIC
ncbi:unnamed protein product [Aphanomyces euteiches]|uniref:RING-type domain-containing protein n=1 Tax=Aphanomyces euteiches TaxID=100861 RepID=A0A6G0XBW8_9STRA|nr:hypothetical protein Ae201684_006291 [Aphanomyces euteiches]KAH9091156.1 hypothetical protein Ae201684P_006556 [Aphanomyces euteiches]